MKRFFQPSLGKLTALFSLGAVLGVVYTGGQQMFSPGGDLSERSRRGHALGGVATHADLGDNCAACHVAPWSEQVMADRCLDCHADVQAQIAANHALHGLIPAARECRVCHTEHRGAHAALTRFTHFDHDWCTFKLTGKHRTLNCQSCHKNQTYQGTPHQCASCHTEPAVHQGQFGTNCVHCHTTTTWTDATFRHTFPIHHGGGKQGRSCATCHEVPQNLQSYTCYNCHRHQPSQTAKKHQQLGLVDIGKCADCHPFGRRQRQAAISKERAGH